MRLRALAPLILILSLLLAACDATGLPPAGTPTSVVEPTATTEAALPTRTTPRQNPTPTAVSVRPSATATTAEAAATPDPQGTVDPVAEAQITQIEEDTSRLRGLQPKSDVPEIFINEAQLRENLIRDTEAEYPVEEAQDDARQLWLLRLTNDPALDLRQLYIDLQTEQVAGYYDPDKKELYVRKEDGELSPLARQTLSHEFVHSLQDQHFDLNKMLPDDTTDDDRALAVRALVEGDATISGLLYAQAHMTEEEFNDMLAESAAAETTVLDKAPRYIRDSLIFPYEKGVEFIMAVGGLNSFRSVDQAMKDPPASTEQIMHPEKYLGGARDEPKPAPVIPLTGTLNAGWTMNDNGTIGEFDLQIILDENGASDASRASEGWGGGNYAYYRHSGGDQSLLLVNTAWDSRADADEFEAAMRETFAVSGEEGDFWSDGRRLFAIKRVGDNVWYGASTDRNALESAMDSIK
ncbi:MAG TPA: hypothetical protein VFR15_01280 [Chloroflexia bacterium]|nr:hypothetical protein [Chloroflexia bacterium]